VDDVQKTGRMDPKVSKKMGVFILAQKILVFFGLNVANINNFIIFVYSFI
jgi:uncharacterized membrane protein